MVIAYDLGRLYEIMSDLTETKNQIGKFYFMANILMLSEKWFNYLWIFNCVTSKCTFVLYLKKMGKSHTL